MISIHVPSRGTTCGYLAIAQSSSKFQSTYPQGVRRKSKRSIFSYSLFQSTYPQGVRPDEAVAEKTMQVISIHVPSRGTTVKYGARLIRMKFQSTYPQGVRPHALLFSIFGIRFQSTYPQGVRQTGPNGLQDRVHISIHVPSRGTT